MTNAQTNEPASRKPLRLWPGVLALVLLWLFRFGVPRVVPGLTGALVGVIGALVCTLAIVVWWAFFSRAPRVERWGALVLMIVAMLAASRLIHESIATGMMGMMFGLYAIPVLCLAFVAWAVLTRRLADGLRRATLIATILLACGAWILLRSDGITGDGAAQFTWRWAETPEERLLAQAGGGPAALPSAPAAAETSEEESLVLAEGESAALPPAPPAAEKPEDANQPAALLPAPAVAKRGAEWPGFRGPARDSIIPGIRIETDWSQSPPVELWRRRVGPGWSSFAVRGDLFYTQEQRGDDEVVACYKATTGEPVWSHRDSTRFWEANAGAGPRATPTLSGGRVYTFGATGILNVLDAASGGVVWSRNVASDAGVEVPYWGFASSPLVVDDLVIVAAAGQLAAYDLATGEPRWFGPTGGTGYSSPHLLTLDGVAQVLLLSEAGAISVAPTDGTVLWEHRWDGFSIVQPALTADGDILLGSDQVGTRRIAVAHGASGWTTEERWTSVRLKPYFNDFVIHAGHAYGFDGGILACIDLADGKRKWKGGRYGHGQLVLLPDQDLLLVVTEEGELALVAATPDQFTEFARFPAIHGKTWNHPVLVDDLLLVRNGQEMVAFRLSRASR